MKKVIVNVELTIDPDANMEQVHDKIQDIVQYRFTQIPNAQLRASSYRVGE